MLLKAKDEYLWNRESYEILDWIKFEFVLAFFAIFIWVQVAKIMENFSIFLFRKVYYHMYYYKREGSKGLK